MNLGDLVPFLITHVLEAATSGLVGLVLGKPFKRPYPLSRRIPALLMRIVTVPKLSTAVLITAAPSVTEDVFTTALPPARRFHKRLVSRVQWQVEIPAKLTSSDLVNDLLSSLSVEVVHDDISATRGK